MNEETLDDFARNTALDILKRLAPDCLQRTALRDAIARLARQGIESSIRLYWMQHQPSPAEQQRRETAAE
jgi:hypothetical protein